MADYVSVRTRKQEAVMKRRRSVPRSFEENIAARLVELGLKAKAK